MPSASPPKSCRNRWNEHRWMLLAAGWACGKKGKVEAGGADSVIPRRTQVYSFLGLAHLDRLLVSGHNWPDREETLVAAPGQCDTDPTNRESHGNEGVEAVEGI